MEIQKLLGGLYYGDLHDCVITAINRLCVLISNTNVYMGLLLKTQQLF